MNMTIATFALLAYQNRAKTCKLTEGQAFLAKTCVDNACTTMRASQPAASGFEYKCKYAGVSSGKFVTDIVPRAG